MCYKVSKHRYNDDGKCYAWFDHFKLPFFIHKLTNCSNTTTFCINSFDTPTSLFGTYYQFYIDYTSKGPVNSMLHKSKSHESARKISSYNNIRARCGFLTDIRRTKSVLGHKKEAETWAEGEGEECDRSTKCTGRREMARGLEWGNSGFDDLKRQSGGW